jgi:hypothetical protein
VTVDVDVVYWVSVPTVVVVFEVNTSVTHTVSSTVTVEVAVTRTSSVAVVVAGVTVRVVT